MTFPAPTLPNVDFRILRFIFMTYDYICVCVFNLLKIYTNLPLANRCISIASVTKLNLR